MAEEEEEALLLSIGKGEQDPIWENSSMFIPAYLAEFSSQIHSAAKVFSLRL